MICAVYGEGAVTDRTCQKWFVKFCAGGFSLDDALWSGRPVEGDSDQTETRIDNDQCSTTGEVADVLKTSQSMQLLLKVKNEFYFMEKSKRTFWPTP